MHVYFARFITCFTLILGMLCGVSIILADDGKDKTREPSEAMLSRGKLLARSYVADDTRPVIAGDVLRFQVLEDEEPAVFLRVNVQGSVDFPYLGKRSVQGMTCKAIGEMIAKELENTYYYKATVFLSVEQENPIRGSVYIIGEVSQQGKRDIPAGMDFTLSKAILAAGGFTSYARESRVRLVRETSDGKETTTEIDVGKIFETGNRENDVVLQPNDLIIVPKSAINF